MSSPIPQSWPRVGLLCVVVMYAISLFLPVIQVFSQGDPIYGWEIVWSLLQRPLEGFRDDKDLAIFATLYWLPNLSLWAGVILAFLGRWWLAALAGVAGLIMASVWMINFEKGTLEFYLAGYYCWLGSMWLLAALASVVLLLARRNLRQVRL